MNPNIRSSPERKLIGKKIETTLADNRTAELWRSFMLRRKEIVNSNDRELFSIEVYDPSLDFNNFNKDTPFEKWAAIEVAGFDVIPAGMEPFTLPAGLYAVFIYRGPANNFAETFRYIFGTWLPSSDYLLDARPHFELMGKKYKNNDPDSEEEIWIPIMPKN